MLGPDCVCQAAQLAAEEALQAKGSDAAGALQTASSRAGISKMRLFSGVPFVGVI